MVGIHIAEKHGDEHEPDKDAEENAECTACLISVHVMILLFLIWEECTISQSICQVYFTKIFLQMNYAISQAWKAKGSFHTACIAKGPEK